MVMVCFAAGMTTRAFFQISASVGDDSAFSPGHIGEDHRDLNAVYDANGYPHTPSGSRVRVPFPGGPHPTLRLLEKEPGPIASAGQQTRGPAAQRGENALDLATGFEGVALADAFVGAGRRKPAAALWR